jgi:urease accessory protein UreE
VTTLVLKGGVSVDADVWRFALDLEGRGVRLALDESDRLLAGPSELLTREDVEAIRVARYELKRLVIYCADISTVM